MKESKFVLMTMEQIKAHADSLNCDVVLGAPNQLQFDLDDHDAESAFEFFWHTKLTTRFTDAIREEWASKSGHKHVVVTLPQNFTVQERIALQAMGASDIGREFASLACFWDGSPHPILLFKPRPSTPPAPEEQ